ncbi:hypothetical protein QIH80_23815 [Bradyrhizobium elkanii]|nr:hypothetical protein QIH80_23815 [Bradyrhizobium elkanii]
MDESTHKRLRDRKRVLGQYLGGKKITIEPGAGMKEINDAPVSFREIHRRPI